LHDYASPPAAENARSCRRSGGRDHGRRAGTAALPSGIVTQTLGGNDELAAVDAHLARSPLSEDTSYLICTDGLTDPVPDELLDQVLPRHQDGRAVCELWKAAIEAAGPDNIAIALVRLGT
jgi:serine/threonine protein phosphatase PrpC